MVIGALTAIVIVGFLMLAGFAIGEAAIQYELRKVDGADGYGWVDWDYHYQREGIDDSGAG